MSIEGLDPRILDGGEVWRDVWDALPRRARTKIKRSVERGQALPDHVDAAIAVGYVRSLIAARARQGFAALIDPVWNPMADRQMQNAEESNLAVVRAHLEEHPDPG